MPNLKSFLPLVSKPTRYINHEINAVHKDAGKVRTKVALIFPDVYEIGMSHLGLHILYHILNARRDILAERAYAPWLDMEAVLRRNDIPLCSLESRRPLAEFDILGFTLPYEMCYTNVLNILDLAHIPLRAAERDERHPLVIGGGASVYNPEPLAEFFDFFLLGDGEEAILEIVDLFARWKADPGDKQSLLEALADIPGGYVPSLFEPRYHRSGEIAAITPLLPGYEEVRRRVVADLNLAAYPTCPIVPYMGISHDRLNIEIARGCSRGCRFCQAGLTYRPVRERHPRVISRLLAESISSTGYEEVSFSALSTGDYSCWPQLLELMGDYESQRISLSLPSLRPGTLTPAMIKQISRVRKTGFTIAPEAGSSRLRKVINKGISHEDIMNTAQAVFKAGWSGLKLYFMIGLPTEEQEDIEGIAAIVEEINRSARRVGGHRPKQLNISISCFVPKPHTPFQWWPQASLDSIRDKQSWLNGRLRRRPFFLKWQRPEVSRIEGLLARGDRRLGRLLLRVWQLGAKFDGWLEQFDLTRWEQALSDCSIDPDFYLTRSRGTGEILPWEHLHTGVSKEFLLSEYERALRGEATPDCRQAGCINCGVCNAENKLEIKTAAGGATTATVARPEPHPATPRFRLRARFCKRGELRFLSQLEISRVIARAVRRAGIPVRYSEGFHPHPKISFAAALPVGTESSAEYVDLELKAPLPPEELKNRLNKVLPAQLQVMEVNRIPLGSCSLSQVSDIFGYRIRIPCKPDETGDSARAQQAHIRDFLAQPQILVDLPRKQVDARPAIIKLELLRLDSQYLELELILKSQLRPQALIQKLYPLSPSQLMGLEIERTDIWSQHNDQWYTPLEVGS
jgi:radical SAM family uncharacterized protein/radical SAM-linked protein